jgi:hypothetical protein
MMRVEYKLHHILVVNMLFRRDQWRLPNHKGMLIRRVLVEMYSRKDMLNLSLDHKLSLLILSLRNYQTLRLQDNTMCHSTKS